MAIRFLSSETIDGALTVNSTVTLNKTNNVINIPSLVDNGKFLQVTQVGNETWEFKCESLSGSLDGVTIGTTPGKVAFDENGQIQSIQLLDVATAGGRLTGFSNRGYLSSIHLEQTATNTDGGYIRFLTAASGTTSGLERFKITETGAFSVGPSGTNYGTSGQVLTSQGNALPTWTTPTTGTITGSGTADKVTKFTSATAIGDGPITFATNDSSFTGHVGIGVTAHATASLNITNANQHIRLNNGSELGIISLDSDGKLDLWAHGDGETIDFRTGSGTGTVAMSVVGTNVGIGLTSPGAKLDVLQEARVSFANSNQYTLRITNTDGNPRILADGSAAHLIFGTTPSGSATATEKMRITSAGNVGINTTTPAHKLSVLGDQLIFGDLLLEGSANSFRTISMNTSDGSDNQTLSLCGGATASSARGARVEIKGNETGGDVNIIAGNVSTGDIDFYTANASRMIINNAGNVGIGYSSPSYKLDVNGVTRTRGFLQESNIFEDVADTAYFTNATADQNVDIILGNISMWGYIEITITGTYSYQSTPGKLTKLYAVGLNSGGTIYENNSRIVDAIGPINGNIYLDDLRWDSTVSQYRIRVAHIVSTGNQYSIKINAFSHSTGALNLAGWSISGLYTQSTSGLLAQNASYLNYLGIGTENATVQLQVERNTNSNHPMLFLDTTGGGSGCVGLNSSAAIGPYIEGNTNIDGTVRGAYGGSRMLFNAGGFTFQFSDETSGTRTFDSLMTIQGSTGKVGIGTTSPSAKLFVKHDVASEWAGTFQNLSSNAYGLSIDCSSASAATFVLAAYSPSGTGMFLNGSGNVGIGTTAPTKKLEISGAGGSGGPLMRLNNTSGSGASGPTIDFGYSGQTWRVGANVFAAGDFAIYDTGNSTHLLLINNAGDFGIGTTNPGAISGGCTTMTFGSTAAALSGGVLFQANGTNVNGTYWESDNMRYQNTGDYSHTFYKNNSTVLFTIATTGTVTATGDVVAYSDERLKTNIKTLDGSKVFKMRGVSFEKEGKKGSGVIAQELEKIAPELVNNDSEYKGVAYGNLSGYLIEAIKEQQKQIDRLEEQIKKMSSKN
tara:strand:+ start:3756 stop:6977 length:3222 start_codon:yes stop_codon:yes gene_type:complete